MWWSREYTKKKLNYRHSRDERVTGGWNNVRLGITSEDDLRTMARGLRNFEVHAMEEFQEKLPKHINAVYNTATRDTGGQHWVAVHNSPKREHVTYWDSFGQAIDPRLLKYLKTSGKKVVRNTSQIQNINADSCGYWAVWVLRELESGKAIGEILSQIDGQDQEENEAMLRQEY